MQSHLHGLRRYPINTPPMDVDRNHTSHGMTPPGVRALAGQGQGEEADGEAAEPRPGVAARAHPHGVLRVPGARCSALLCASSALQSKGHPSAASMGFHPSSCLKVALSSLAEQLNAVPVSQHKWRAPPCRAAFRQALHCQLCRGQARTLPCQLCRGQARTLPDAHRHALPCK